MTLSAQAFVSIVTLLIMVQSILGFTAYLILLERRTAAWVQDRMGPNRVGPFGLFQPIADGLKMLMKEDYEPGMVDRGLFYAAPVLAVVPALIGWAVVPWGGVWNFPGMTIGPLTVEPGIAHVAAAPLNIGVIYILAIGSLAVYGVVVGAWASNNKYSFFGGLRATAQMLSYEIPMGLIVLSMLLMVGSARADDLVNAQAGYYFGVLPAWLIIQQPIAAVLFFVCILAESNRAPFDLAEAEQELVGGYHTEFSSMKLGLLLMGEYMHMLTASAFLVILFLGGWHLPWIDYLVYGSAQPVVGELGGVLLKSGVFIVKMLLVTWLMMWVRWTLPRFRFDQLMRLAWQGLIPITLVLLLATGVITFLRLSHWMWLVNGVLIFALPMAGRWIPVGPPTNRRIRLAGSRFSPAAE
jgi:NADH-quinone oxidoreductase subunit H